MPAVCFLLPCQLVHTAMRGSRGGGGAGYKVGQCWQRNGSVEAYADAAGEPVRAWMLGESLSPFSAVRDADGHAPGVKGAGAAHQADAATEASSSAAFLAAAAFSAGVFSRSPYRSMMRAMRAPSTLIPVSSPVQKG